jgi:starch synthase
MKKARVLFVSQEITPYLPETPMSHIGRYLPQGILELGKEIRTFMPRYGLVNERRNQLHEVIRLSGMNLIIDNTDNPLIIKVASIQSARMQVYFIDNEDFFHRKALLTDNSGKPFEDHDERMIFFCRGVIETVKKLGWNPDIIHCHGSITSLIPLYIKRSFRDNPLFTESRVIYSVYDDEYPGSLNKNMARKAMHEGVEKDDLDLLKPPNWLNITKTAIHFSDAVIKGSPKINGDIEKFTKKSGKPFLEYHDLDEYIDAYSEFYDEILEEEPVFAD